jgi:PAS domain S-box-containing protein
MSLLTISILPLMISGMISVGLGIYTWRHRNIVGARSFALLMAFLSQWTFSYILQIFIRDLPAKIFWDKITFIGITMTPVVWLIFSLEYSERKDWANWKRVSLLMVVPVITNILIWTNEYHHLFWTTRRIYEVGDMLLQKSAQAPFFWVHAGYSYLVILAGTIVIVRKIFSWPQRYRTQMLWVLLAISAPWISNIITIFDLVDVIIDLTPFAFTVTGIGMAIALFRHRMLELAPIARDVVLTGLRDAMIVLDENDQVVDVNDAAITKLNLSKPIGKSLNDALGKWHDLIEFYTTANQDQAELTLGKGSKQQWFDVRLTPLYQSRRGKDSLMGKLILARDITERKRAEIRLHASEARFRQIVENASDFIYRTDLEGYFTYANPASLHTMGFSSEDEILGKYSLDYVAPEHRHKLRRNYQKQYFRKIPLTYYEYQAIHTEGYEFWVGQNAQLLLEDEEPVGFEILARDISAIKKAQDALRLARDQALDASRAKSQLLAKVSHELRTPLGAF